MRSLAGERIADFYITGGTLPRDALCYVPRQADIDLLDGLRHGEFCFVLTARQMGKSSLMVHTATKLRSEGFACVILDLTAVGQNVDAERWYGGLINQVGQQTGLEDELDDAWLAPSLLGPLQRWMHCLKTVVLNRLATEPAPRQEEHPSPAQALAGSHSLVMFIDEIDAVRSLPFSADEFFAGIRQCYNRRSEDPDFLRLTFCLLGVATPTDLIRDTRTTPFNIGTRIELTYFTPAEASVLGVGLGQRRSGREGAAQSEYGNVLRRVLYWTGGHPYLTQRLCRSICETASTEHVDNHLVDRLCAELFLDSGAAQRDDNLVFVRERLLRNTADLAGLLHLYQQVWDRTAPPVDETDPLLAALMLSGIAGISNGRIRPRNRIYDRVFDRRWVEASMPGAELRRQRSAYRSGLLRATVAATAIIAVMAGLIVYALQQRQTSEKRLLLLSKEQLETERNRDETTRLLYISNMNLIQRYWEARPSRMAWIVELLQETGAAKFHKFRGFEWAYWNSLCHRDLRTFDQKADAVTAAAFSPDASVVLTGSSNGVARLWDSQSGRLKVTLRGHSSSIAAVAFSPDGARIVTGSEDGTAAVWDARSGDRLATLKGHEGYVVAVSFSPDGRRALTGSWDNTAKLWDVDTGSVIRTFRGHTGYVSSVAFSANGREVVTGSEDSSARIWNSETGKAIRVEKGPSDGVAPAVLSPDGKWLLTRGHDNVATVKSLESKRVIVLKHAGRITSAVFSPDSSRILAGSEDATATLWVTATGHKALSVIGHVRPVTAAAFSADGSRLLTGSGDGTAKIWSAQPQRDSVAANTHQRRDREDTIVMEWDALSGRPTHRFEGHAGHITSALYSPDGKSVLTAGYDGIAEMWSAAGTRLRALRGHDGPVTGAAFSSTGDRILSGGADKTVKIWTAATGKEVGSLKGHTGQITSVAFSPDGSHILTGSRDATARLWDSAVPAKTIRTLVGHAGSVSSVAFAPGGKRVVTGSEDTTAKLWDVETGQVIHTLAGQSGPIASIAFSGDGNHILTGSWDHTVWLWNAKTGKVEIKIYAQVGPVFSVVLSPDGKQIVAGGATRKVTLWDSRTGKQLLLLDRAAAPVALSPDGRHLLTAIHSSGTIDTFSGMDKLIAKATSGMFSVVAFSPDLKHFLTDSSDNTATLFNKANPGRQMRLKGHTGPVLSVAFSPDGNRLLTGSEDATVKLWDTATGREILTLKSDIGAVASVAFSRDGETITAANRENTICEWHAR